MNDHDCDACKLRAVCDDGACIYDTISDLIDDLVEIADRKKGGVYA